MVNYTPLRYAGGKQRLVEQIKRIMQHNELHHHYAEVYAGGAGLALTLLFQGECSAIHLNDADKAVYGFWYSVLNHTEELNRLIVDTPVTVEEWLKQREVLKREDVPLLEQGFAAFFLNRTCRSGILNAGIIGGLKQNGRYKLTDRFNKSALISRIERIAERSSVIHLSNEDARSCLLRLKRKLPRSSLVYLDPPYYQKGKALYRKYYEHQDHLALRDTLVRSPLNWVLSYDNDIAIREMYDQFRIAEYSLNYSVQTKRKAIELMIFGPTIKAAF